MDVANSRGERGTGTAGGEWWACVWDEWRAGQRGSGPARRNRGEPTAVTNGPPFRVAGPFVGPAASHPDSHADGTYKPTQGFTLCNGPPTAGRSGESPKLRPADSRDSDRQSSVPSSIAARSAIIDSAVPTQPPRRKPTPTTTAQDA